MEVEITGVSVSPDGQALVSYVLNGEPGVVRVEFDDNGDPDPDRLDEILEEIIGATAIRMENAQKSNTAKRAKWVRANKTRTVNVERGRKRQKRINRKPRRV